MKIEVTTLTGITTTYDVEPTDTIESLREKVSKKENLHILDIRLVFKGNLLDKNEKTLEDCEIKDKTRLHLIVRLRGC